MVVYITTPQKMTNIDTFEFRLLQLPLLFAKRFEIKFKEGLRYLAQTHFNTGSNVYGHKCKLANCIENYRQRFSVGIQPMFT